MGCGDSRVVPPSLPTREEATNSAEERVNFEHHDALDIKTNRRNRDRPQQERGSPAEPQDDESSGADFDGEFDFITENSPQDLVNKVIFEFVPVDDKGKELVIVGIPCTRLLSAVQRTKMEEAEILESLRSEGLIYKSLKKSHNSLGFEIVEESSAYLKPGKFVPVSIRDKEDRPDKVVTNETIADKLAKAEAARRREEDESDDCQTESDLKLPP